MEADKPALMELPQPPLIYHNYDSQSLSEMMPFRTGLEGKIDKAFLGTNDNRSVTAAPPRCPMPCLCSGNNGPGAFSQDGVSAG